MNSTMISATVRTNNMNRAAFLTSFGAEIIELVGKYPDQTFVLKSPQWLIFYEKYIGFVRYKKYVNQRLRLKRKGRKQSGLPERFTGHDKGFQLQDVAHVRSFTKSELSR